MTSHIYSITELTDINVINAKSLFVGYSKCKLWVMEKYGKGTNIYFCCQNCPVKNELVPRTVWVRLGLQGCRLYCIIQPIFFILINVQVYLWIIHFKFIYINRKVKVGYLLQEKFVQSELSPAEVRAQVTDIALYTLWFFRKPCTRVA